MKATSTGRSGRVRRSLVGGAGLLLAGVLLAASPPLDRPERGLEPTAPPVREATPRRTEARVPEEFLEARALPALAGLTNAPMFERLGPDRTGLTFVHRWTTDPRYERLFNSSTVGGGVCAGDYDADGLPDLCLTRPAGGARLYHNEGGFRFTDVTEQAGVLDAGAWTTGASFADLDGDGRLDLFVCGYAGPNRFYRNRGDGTFAEEAAARGLNFNGASLMMAFADYDRDGRLDGYLLTAGLMPNASQKFRVKFVDGRPTVPEELQEFWQLFYLPGDRAAMAEAGQLDRLFHQEPDGRFREVAARAGLRGCDFGNAAVWWDFNADGWPDLYVANDYFGPDRLYRNNRDGTFTDVARDALPSTPWTSMGADTADFDGDGRPDLIASDMSGTTRFKRVIDSGDLEKSGWFLDWAEPRQYLRNALFLNTGRDRFLEVAQLAGLAHTDWTWSVVCGDLDCDGREDVFVPNGMTRDWMDNDLAVASKPLAPAEFTRFWRGQPVRADRNLAFRNLGDLRFENVAGSWGLDQPGPSFGAVLVDLDADGRLDVVVNDFDASPRVHRNVGAAGNRVVIRMNDTSPNRFGVGAQIRLETAAGPQVRYLTPAHGFMSATEPAVHFGLGDANLIPRLTLEWPDGRRQTFTNLAANHAYRVTAPAGNPGVTPEAAPPVATPAFTASPLLAGIRHQAPTADDLQRQPLLPWIPPVPGPGVAWVDVDGDGTREFHLDGAAAHATGLYRRGPDGRFVAAAGDGGAAMAPDATTLYFEANGDGFPDRLRVRPPAGERPGAVLLELNDGHGGFRAAPAGALPSLATGVGIAAAADFDRDGDLDLALGGVAVPGRYPQATPGHLWRNDAGNFHEVTAELAPALAAAGLVTAALWSDADGDGWLDLLVATDWGPVRWFRNQDGRLSDHTAAAGLSEWTGWWRALAAGDFDQDGDLDYAVGNLGANTRYQPTPDAPARLYLAEPVPGAGPQPFEAIVDADGLWPLRGRTALEQAIPGLIARFPTHQAFARAPLAEVLGTDVLAQARGFAVNTARSGLLRNTGSGFRFEPWPWPAQTAPVLGLAVADFDGDGLEDVALAGNFHDAHRETGRMNGGAGLLLHGRRGGGFEPVPANASGLVLPGDNRGVSAADLNADGWPDLTVAVRNAGVLAFEHQPVPGVRRWTLQLRGRPGNPEALGARVTLKLRDGTSHGVEPAPGAGGGVAFGLGQRGEPDTVEVRWPEGATTRHPAAAARGTTVLQPPRPGT